jgi:hypothetical protein
LIRSTFHLLFSGGISLENAGKKYAGRKLMESRFYPTLFILNGPIVMETIVCVLKKNGQYSLLNVANSDKNG